MLLQLPISDLPSIFEGEREGEGEKQDDEMLGGRVIVRGYDRGISKTI